MAICTGSTFTGGNQSQYIKFQGSDIVAVEGVNTVERLIASDVRFPYKQILKSRIILKAGQVDYLFNFLGLGDNATFLAMKAVYNSASVNEEDNYILWNYYDDFSKKYPMDQFMLLTGNSTHRIKQIYLTNPSTKYPVILDVMVASIDDTYTFFPDIVNQSGTTFTGLRWYDLITYVIGESFYVQDTNNNPLIYIQLANINSISRNANYVVIDDNTVGTIILVFTDVQNAAQADSALNYLLNHGSSVLPLPEDIESPILYWYQYVDNNPSNDYISFNGATGGSFSTSDGLTFSTSLSIGTFGPTISKDNLINYLIYNVEDNRDGVISVTSSMIHLSTYENVSISAITISGTYSMTFSIADLALNNIDNVKMTLLVI